MKKQFTNAAVLAVLGASASLVATAALADTYKSVGCVSRAGLTAAVYTKTDASMGASDTLQVIGNDDVTMTADSYTSKTGNYVWSATKYGTKYALVLITPKD